MSCCLYWHVVASGESASYQLIGSAVWCLTSHDDIVIAGCRNGAIEVCILIACCYHIFCFLPLCGLYRICWGGLTSNHFWQAWHFLARLSSSECPFDLTATTMLNFQRKARAKKFELTTVAEALWARPCALWPRPCAMWPRPCGRGPVPVISDLWPFEHNQSISQTNHLQRWPVGLQDKTWNIIQVYTHW